MDKKIVIPGDLLSDDVKKSGYGTYVKNDKIYSSLCGIESLKEDKVGVIPLAGAYIPLDERCGDRGGRYCGYSIQLDTGYCSSL